MAVNNETVDRIVDIEWKMFDAVNEGEARAECQEDKVTFAAMRKAQFLAWSEDACGSYLGDLKDAERSHRNLISEKYIHMMKTTEPAKYDELLYRVKLPSEAVKTLAKNICDIMVEETEKLFLEFPYVSGAGRPLYSTQDFGGTTSVETYQLGELLTYSENTLKALYSHIRDLAQAHRYLSRVILENTVKYYGYSSLEAAEAATKARIDKIGIQLSFGCSCDDTCAI